MRSERSEVSGGEIQNKEGLAIVVSATLLVVALSLLFLLGSGIVANISLFVAGIAVGMVAAYQGARFLRELGGDSFVKMACISWPVFTLVVTLVSAVGLLSGTSSWLSSPVGAVAYGFLGSFIWQFWLALLSPLYREASLEIEELKILGWGVGLGASGLLAGLLITLFLVT